MNSSAPQRWLPAALGSSVVYLVAGTTFAALAHRAGSNQLRVTWRLAAWIISAAVFAAQAWYEHTRLRSARPLWSPSPRLPRSRACDRGRR